MTDSRVKQLNDLLADAIEMGDDDQIEIINQELFTINPHYVKEYNQGGHVKSSAETSVIPGAATKGSAQGSTIRGPRARGSAEGSTISMKPMKMRSGGLAKRGYGKERR